jgi:hypothetical protein
VLVMWRLHEQFQHDLSVCLNIEVLYSHSASYGLLSVKAVVLSVVYAGASIICQVNSVVLG